MKYYTYTQAEAERVRKCVISNEFYELNSFGAEIGEGDLLELEPIRIIAGQAVSQCEDGENPEVVELSLSGDVYMALRQVPVQIRDDAGFWRWVTISSMMPFLVKRYSPLDKEAIGAGTNSSDILACRMFLRAQASRVEGDKGNLEFDLITDLGPKKHDFWQSHILRVSTGSERPLARALIESHSRESIPTKQLRDFVRDSINRPKTTIATFLMNFEESKEFVERQRKLFAESMDSDRD